MLEAVTDNICVKSIVSAGNFAYMQIPADKLRCFCDNLFPELAKNSTADIVSGAAHRWKAGHDIFIDIPRTALDKGFGKAAKQAGHVLLTDFPTKAGIPIPGLSQSGLGEFLVKHGIDRAFLSLNLTDAFIGIFAMSESTFDMINVVSQQLRMTPELFIDTFVEGTVELVAGGICKNPLLFFSGISEVTAGLVATFNTITQPLWYVNPLDFFGCGLCSALLSIVFSKFVFKRNNKEVAADCCKSVLVSSLFAIYTGFGVGGIIALSAWNIGKVIAQRDNARKKECFSIFCPDLAVVFTNLLSPEELNKKDLFHNTTPCCFDDMVKEQNDIFQDVKIFSFDDAGKSFVA